MNIQATLASVLLIGLLSVASAEENDEGPRTGYFETEITLLELLGP